MTHEEEHLQRLRSLLDITGEAMSDADLAAVLALPLPLPLPPTEEDQDQNVPRSGDVAVRGRGQQHHPVAHPEEQPGQVTLEGSL